MNWFFGTCPLTDKILVMAVFILSFLIILGVCIFLKEEDVKKSVVKPKRKRYNKYR